MSFSQSASAGADVGILNADRQPAANANDGGDCEQPGDATEAMDGTAYFSSGVGSECWYNSPSDRWDVYEALNNASYRGSCCAADRADGTTTAPALPAAPGLRIVKIGRIPLPISDHHAKAIRSNAWKIKDKSESYHKIFQIEPRQMKIQNPAWDASLKKLVQTAAYKLGVSSSNLTAELDMLLYMGKGSQVDRCRNVAEEKVLGTLLIQLPSVFSGGEIRVFSGSYDHFDLGASGEAEFSCHFICHYADCEYEMKEIKSGYRLLLRYVLLYQDGSTVATPTASLLRRSMWPLEWSLRMLPPADRILLVPTAKDYKASSLSNGINALSHPHRSKAEAIKAAAKGWKLLIVIARMKHTLAVGLAHAHSSRTSSIIQIFDEEGNDVSTQENWLKTKGLLEFDAPFDEDEGVGMMLGYDECLSDVWGPPQTISSSGHPNRYVYDSAVDEAMTSVYRATFLLAYDMNYADDELKCLSGSEGVAAVADKIVAKRDYELFERLLSVVEAKEKSKFNVRSCRKLLQMMARSTGKGARSSNRIAMANKTLQGLSTSIEPDVELYDAILAIVDTLGHDQLSDSIEKLLDDDTRKRDHELSVFLRRANFILNLNKRLEGGSSYLEKSISDLISHGKPRVSNSDEINTAILSLIATHGWEEVSGVLEASLNFLHTKIPSRNRSFSALYSRAILLTDLHCANHYTFVQACLADFAADFVEKLGDQPHAATSHLNGTNGNQQKPFVDAIRLVMRYGTKASFDKLGEWAVSNEECLSALLNGISESNAGMGPEALFTMIRNILNKCLVQSVVSSPYGWRSHKKEDGSVPPSIHIRKVLEAYPGIPQTTDKDGRFTLHYAVDSKSASFEAVMDIFEANPKVASARDPKSGLYPFMLAASNGNVAASSSLLLADPSLVHGGTQVDAASKKKRKRNPPMG